MDFIIQLDRSLFFFINQTIANPLFDAILPWLRVDTFWIPLYIFLLLFLLMNMKNKKHFILWVICFVALVGITDFISSHLIKPNFYRLRPCRDGELHFTVRLLAGYCGHNSSFISSHASNHFSMALFCSATLQQFFSARKLKIVAISWASIICFSQIYVGVHYPLDIVGGILVGAILSTIFVKIFYVIHLNNIFKTNY